MTKKEYNSWISDLAASSDPGKRDIGLKAQQSAWYLDNYIGCDGSFESFSSTCPDYCQDEDDFMECIKAGWITLHDGWAAIWADGLI